jgi:hypothetical protein
MRGACATTVAAVACACLSACLCLSACFTLRLDKAVFYEGPNFKLRLVRSYEMYVPGANGKVFRVECLPPRVETLPGHPKQDRAWIWLANGNAHGTGSAEELVERERRKYIVIDDRTLVTTGNCVNVTFNACLLIRQWCPTSLPAGLINPVEKPSYCAPMGSADCSGYDFDADRQPSFDDIRVTPRGEVSFIVRSLALKNEAGVRVQSDNFGRTWRIEPL